MRVRILHQSWSVGGAVRCEGDEFETDDPNIIAHAIGLNHLGKPRMDNAGRRVHGDHRACEALTEPTAEERKAAEAFLASQQPVSRGGYGGRGAAPVIELSPKSLEAIAAGVAAVLQTAKPK